MTYVDGILVGFAQGHGSPALADRVANDLARSLGDGFVATELGSNREEYELRPAGRSTAMSLGEAWEAARELANRPWVRFAEPSLVGPGVEPHLDELTHGERQAMRIPSVAALLDEHLVESLPRGWARDLVHAQAAWDVPLPTHGKGRRYGAGIVIGHPDTGYTRHPAIWSDAPSRNRVLVSRGLDFLIPDVDPLDENHGGFFEGHGTSTASVIMGTRRASGDPLFERSVDSIAPEADLIPLRVASGKGPVHLFGLARVARAIHHAVDEHCDVISMSLGSPFGGRALEAAIARAISQGVIVIAAAGNFWPFVVYPARHPSVLATGACNAQRNAWRWTARGPSVDVSAPGESVWVADTEDGDSYVVKRSDGTSHAAATLAGVAALWLAYHGRDRLVQRYGKHNIPSLFKHVVTSTVQAGGAELDEAVNGRGIVDAAAVLRAELPDMAPAIASLASSVALSGAFDEFMELLPGVPPARVRAALMNHLDAHDERELAARLTVYGSELASHLAVDPALRAHLRGEQAALAGAAPPSPPGFSPSLRRAWRA